jgi:hypothetical protein
MIVEIVGLSFLLVGNLLVLRWLVVSDPVDEPEALDDAAAALSRRRTEPDRYRRAA